MAAGTVLSGGFPGRVAQEVQPNPKCNGCLHFDGQVGRTGACTIGLKPWGCGEGDAADIGYAPIARGAGTYLPGMNAPTARAHEVGDQDSASLYGAGSTRAVTIQQVQLSEEHVHFAKSMINQHTSMQKSMCRLCQSNGMIGMGHTHHAPQICTCAPIEARDIAKALLKGLSNRDRQVLDIDDLTAFVYACSKSNFDPSIAKGTFYHSHGKYEMSPAGGGKHHIDFHPRGGGNSTRVGTFDSPKEARRASEVHGRKFAQGSSPQQTEAAAQHIAPGFHAMHGEEKKTGVASPKARKKESIPSVAGAHDVRVKSETPGDDDEDVEKGLSWTVHSSTGQQRSEASHGTYRIQTSGDHHVPSYAPKGTKNFRTLGYGQPTHKEAKQIAAAHHAKAGAVKKSYSEMLDEDDSWLAKGARARKTVATAPEVPQTEKPYKTKFQRPNDSARTETKPSSGYNIDTSKLRARGEAGAAKVMASSPPRSDDGHAARVGQAAFASRTEHKAPRSSVAPSPNRPGQSPVSAPVAAKPAAPKHIDMEEGMSESEKRVSPAAPSRSVAQVPSMSTMPKKEEATAPRASYKSVDDSVDALLKARDEIEKSEEGGHSFKTGQLVVHNPSGDSKASGTIGAVGMRSNKTHIHLKTASGAPRMVHHSEVRAASSEDKKYHADHINKMHGLGFVNHDANKSLDALLQELHDEEDVEKSLRWSHKAPGEAKTSHGSYTVHHDASTGHHVVTYKPKGPGDKGVQRKFSSHREALGAVTEHHIANRPPPKPRKKRDPNAPKKPKAGAAPTGNNCPC